MAETASEYWRRLIGEQETAGAPVRKYCREHGVSEQSFYAWRKRLRKIEPMRFALVEHRAAANGEAPPELEVLLASGDRLRIGAGVNTGVLRAVVEILRA